MLHTEAPNIRLGYICSITCCIFKSATLFSSIAHIRGIKPDSTAHGRICALRRIYAEEH